MKFRILLLVLAVLAAVGILACRPPRIVRPPAERGAWVPVTSER